MMLTLFAFVTILTSANTTEIVSLLPCLPQGVCSGRWRFGSGGCGQTTNREGYKEKGPVRQTDPHTWRLVRVGGRQKCLLEEPSSLFCLHGH